jgi:hypothetical protein
VGGEVKRLLAWYRALLAETGDLTQDDLAW